MDSTVRQSMARHLSDLRAMSDEELIRQHDAWADWTHASVDYYLEELARRVNSRQSAQMLKLTKVITWLTVLMTILTITNVVFVAISLRKH